jgi:hypothetical protein
MIALAFALTYTGWAALCFAMPSHARSLRERPFARPIVVALRILGSTALLLALFASAATWGWTNGTTAWFGILTIACLCLIGLLAVHARAALLPIALLPVAGLLAVW